MHNPIFDPSTNPTVNLTTNPISVSRVLINKYMSRAQPPPAIFSTAALTAFNLPQKEFVDMAYKHPLILQDELDGYDEAYDDVASDEVRFAGANKYNEFSSIELLENVDEDDCTPQPMPQPDDSGDCKLIGNPNPILVRTWEKLSRRRSTKESTTTDQSLDSDRNSFDGKPKPTCARRRLIFPKRLNESDSSEQFYDSIDNESVFTTHEDDDDAMMQMMAGGEGLAEPPISLTDDAKAKLCWSTDSDKIDVSP